jgi:hypothetical protein
VLKHDKVQLPFMVWSAKQREFSPLLLGMYWLMPAGKVSRRESLNWVVIEELEMGLHPKAISAFMAIVLELLRRDYRVCLATHSPHLLDVAWALQTLKRCEGTDKDVLRLFGLPSNNITKTLAKSALGKSISVQYFKPGMGPVDISNLDPGSNEADVAGWACRYGITYCVANQEAVLPPRSEERGFRAETSGITLSLLLSNGLRFTCAAEAQAEAASGGRAC